ncbi:MAG: hypothetical protein AAB426_01650 [Myxococcota bacterium]
MAFDAKPTLFVGGGSPPPAADLAQRLTTSGAKRYLDLVTGKAIPNEQNVQGRVEKELVSVLRQLDERLGVTLAALPIDEKIAMVERRGRMLTELNHTWARSIALNAKLNQQHAFLGHLKKHMLMERQLLLESMRAQSGDIMRVATETAAKIPSTRYETGSLAATAPRNALARADRTGVSATRGPRRGGPVTT